MILANFIFEESEMGEIVKKIEGDAYYIRSCDGI
jgi:hypothetical protein